MIIGIIAAIAAIGGLFAAFTMERKGGPVAAFIIAALVATGAGFGAFNTTNGEGQAKVMVSVTGDAQGSITKPGIQGKKPWQNIENYDVRNQKVTLASTHGEQNRDADGPQITITDKEGVSANIDIDVQYSIDPTFVQKIYEDYGSQDKFESRLILPAIKAGVRATPSEYGTLELLTSRPEIEVKIAEYLNGKWDKRGVIVENVSLQDIRYPKAVKERFAEAQNARTEVEKAQAELKRNKIQAESNEVLSKSLTPQNLEQLKWETLAKIGERDNLVIVPENFNGMLNLENKTPLQ